MAKHYRYVNGKKLIVVNNYDLGTDVIPDDGESIVPDPTVSDAGKILQVNNAGNLAYVDPPEELPTLTGNAGKVLKVAAGASGVEWADETSDLPAVTIDDAGDVLTVNASGEWEAAAPGGGGGLTLYGPYMATNETAVSYGASGQSSEMVYLAGVYSLDGQTSYDMPSSSAITLLQGFFGTEDTDWKLVSIFPDTLYGGIFMRLVGTPESVDIPVHGLGVYFYCSEELTVYQVGE